MIGFSEIVMIFLISLAVLKPSKMLELAGRAGNWIREFKNVSKGVIDDVRENIITPINEVAEPIQSEIIRPINEIKEEINESINLFKEDKEVR